MKIVELHAIFKGLVQGVGFRWTARDLAERRGIKGIVRNLPDGSVELRAQGTHPTLDQFLLELKIESNPARIDSVDIHFSAAQSSYSSFRIVH